MEIKKILEEFYSSGYPDYPMDDKELAKVEHSIRKSIAEDNYVIPKKDAKVWDITDYNDIVEASNYVDNELLEGRKKGKLIFIEYKTVSKQ